MPKAALGLEDVLDCGGDLRWCEGPCAVHGEEHPAPVDGEIFGFEDAAGEEGVADVGPGTNHVLVDRCAEAGDEGLGRGEIGEVEGDVYGFRAGDAGSDEAVFAVELEEVRAEDGAMLERVLEGAGPILGEVVVDGDAFGMPAMEDAACGAAGGREGGVGGGDVEVGYGAVEFGFSSPLGGKQEEVGTGG